MRTIDIFAFCIAVLMILLLLFHRARFHERENPGREELEYLPSAAWVRAGIFFCSFYLLSWAAGTMERALRSPIATKEQLTNTHWWFWVTGLTVFILAAYWGIWARYTIRFDRKIDLVPQIVFGLFWGTSFGQMFISIWRIAAMIGPSWRLWQQWLLAYVLIGVWQWLLMDMYWDIHISPEHDSPGSIMIKTLATHIPNVTLCLIFLALYDNYVIFIALQTLALIGCSINMRMPAPWSRERTPSPRRVPSIFWKLPRCGGYISSDPENDPYLKAAHLRR